MRSLFEKSKAFPLDDILSATALVVAIVIVARFAWVYPATYLPRIMSQRLRAARSVAAVAVDVHPGLYRRARRGLAGRGAGAAIRAARRRRFPYRDLILFVTFGVIFITLVGTRVSACRRWCAGSASPTPVATNRSRSTNRKSRHGARRSDAALKSLDAITDDRDLSDEVVKLLRARHEIRANQLPDSLDPDAHDVSAAGTALTRELIAAERKFIHLLLRDGKITDEIRRRIERDLDLEEASLANREYRRIPL